MFTYINLVHYCTSGRYDEVQKILDSGDMTTRDLEYGLRKASIASNSTAIKMLLSHGTRVADLAILWACYSQSIPIFEHFLDHGWDINKLVNGKETPLRLVVTSVECTRWLLEHGADPNIASKDGRSTLGSALEYGTLATVELLESYGATFLSDSEIICRIVMREQDIVPALKFALDRGADPNERSSRGLTPLHNAVGWGKLIKEVIECLLEYGADRDAVAEGQTAAQVAEECGETKDILELLSPKAETTSNEPVSPARD